jgi:hypothetical protein
MVGENSMGTYWPCSHHSPNKLPWGRIVHEKLSLWTHRLRTNCPWGQICPDHHSPSELSSGMNCPWGCIVHGDALSMRTNCPWGEIVLGDESDDRLRTKCPWGQIVLWDESSKDEMSMGTNCRRVAVKGLILAWMEMFPYLAKYIWYKKTPQTCTEFWS